MVTQPPSSASKDSGSDDFQLFHGRLVGRGRDIGILAIVLIVYPLVVFLFWMLMSRSSGPIPGIVYLTYWGILLGGGVYVLVCIYNVLRPGARRRVYGVNSKFFFKKFLHGEKDPLWHATRAPAGVSVGDVWDEHLHATRAPAGVSLDGVWDEHWDLSDFSVCVGEKTISLLQTTPNGKDPPLIVHIHGSDFDDQRVYTRLGEALQRVMPKSEMALSAAAIVSLLRGGVAPANLEGYVQWLRGVNFVLDEKATKELREAGATDGLLSAIAKAKR